MFETKLVEKIKTHFMFNNFLSESWAVYEISERILYSRQATDDNIIRRMRIAYWIPKATNTHSEYVTLIAFFTTTMVARTRLNVTLYVHCLYCCVSQ